MSDKRSGRVQSVKLTSKFFPLDIHKSMFINDLSVMIPKYYVEAWGSNVFDSHNKENFKWHFDIEYRSPRELGEKKYLFNAYLQLLFVKDRNQLSSYRLHWGKDFAVKLAEDYPKSFIRSLEFEIGDEYYKNLKFTEFDIGGFKEQLQVKIIWKNNIPVVTIKEYFRVKEESQGFPNIYRELSSYLIADYLLSSEEEVLRRIQTTKWKKRIEIHKELNENIIYILLNRTKGEVYFGQTKKSLSQRYPVNQRHHSFPGWEEYSIIQLPKDTSEHTRLLIERVMISLGTKLFPNILTDEKPVLDVNKTISLVNRKK